MDHYKVAIVGAGASGLYAAYSLVKRGLTSRDIIILEAEDRIGGRIHSIPFKDQWLEMGAEWIHGKGENPLWKFVEENKVNDVLFALFKLPTLQSTFSRLDLSFQIPTVEDNIGTDYEGIFLRNEDGEVVPREILADTTEFLWKIHEEADKFANTQDLCQVPTSIGHFMEEKFNHWLITTKQSDDCEAKQWRKQIYQWFIKYEESDCGCDDLYKLSSVSWGDYAEYGDDIRLKNGYFSVLDVMQKTLTKANVSVLLNHMVTNIDYSAHNVIITSVQNPQQKVRRISADHLVSTMSLGVLKHHHAEIFKPSLPNSLVKTIEEIGFGSVAKIKIKFAESFWDLDNPGFMILLQEEPLAITRDNWYQCIYGFEGVFQYPKMLMGWISGDAARYAETLPDEIIIQDIKMYLESMLQKYHKNQHWQLPLIENVFVTRWSSNPNFRGVYSFRNHQCDLQGITNKDLAHPVFVNGFPKILFAGEATDKDHYGTVHGAMSAAIREVNRLEAFWKNNP